MCGLVFFFLIKEVIKSKSKSMPTGDYPYFSIATPMPQQLFSQEKFGYIEIDASGGTALSSYGDVVIHGSNCLMGDGDAVNGDINVPSISFSGSCVSVSATNVRLDSALSFVNVSLTPGTSAKYDTLNFNSIAPTATSNVSNLYHSGGIYLTSVNTVNNVPVYALCYMP